MTSDRAMFDTTCVNGWGLDPPGRHPLSGRRLSEHPLNEHRLSEHQLSEHQLNEHQLNEHQLNGRWPSQVAVRSGLDSYRTQVYEDHLY